jgi:hypothetical protein
VFDLRAHLAEPAIAGALADRQPASGLGFLFHRPEHACCFGRASPGAAGVTFVAINRGVVSADQPVHDCRVMHAAAGCARRMDEPAAGIDTNVRLARRHRHSIESDEFTFDSHPIRGRIGRLAEIQSKSDRLLGERKKRLARLMGKRRIGIVLSEHTDEDGALIFQQACKLASAPYRSGPSRNWIKIKNPDSPAMIRAREAEWRET